MKIASDSTNTRAREASSGDEARASHRARAGVCRSEQSGTQPPASAVAFAVVAAGASVSTPSPGAAGATPIGEQAWGGVKVQQRTSVLQQRRCSSSDTARPAGKKSARAAAADKAAVNEARSVEHIAEYEDLEEEEEEEWVEVPARTSRKRKAAAHRGGVEAEGAKRRLA